MPTQVEEWPEDGPWTSKRRCKRWQSQDDESQQRKRCRRKSSARPCGDWGSTAATAAATATTAATPVSKASIADSSIGSGTRRFYGHPCKSQADRGWEVLSEDGKMSLWIFVINNSMGDVERCEERYGMSGWMLKENVSDTFRQIFCGQMVLGNAQIENT